MAPSKKQRQSTKESLANRLKGVPPKGLAQMCASMTQLNDTEIQFLQKAMLDVQIHELTDQLKATQQVAAAEKASFTKQLRDHDLVIDDLKSDVRRYEAYIQNLANDRAAAENAESEEHLVLLKTNARLNSELSVALDHIAQLKTQCKQYESKLETLLTSHLHYSMAPPDKSSGDAEASLDATSCFMATNNSSNHPNCLVPMLLSALQHRPVSVPIQVDATTALFHLLKETRNVPVFLDMRGIDTICDVMEGLPTHAQILLNGGHILWKLTFSSRGLHALRSSSRAVVVLVAMLKRISVDAAKQYCWLLHHVLTKWLAQDGEAAEPLEQPLPASHDSCADVMPLLLTLANRTFETNLGFVALEAAYKLTKISPLSIDHLLGFITSPQFEHMVAIPALQLVVMRLVTMHVHVHGILELPEPCRCIISNALQALDMADHVESVAGLKGEVQGMIQTWHDLLGARHGAPSAWPILPSVHRHSQRPTDSVPLTATIRLIQLSASLPDL
ncbi:hypothetical protein H310_05430 [Aphanomyces invadans]|uniref:Uncharacterized protein n=1 Tax=Aphanomyces invadans TaxID=157072 RepID=A0A024U9P8_9STRA|nr:hypothetical protein H310_05430 [Aphanomyces invadans]ETW02994.1 hypothetical protein H310_05430 [Aphanomyces invadans]|eukprot:XP_008868378.1 hypothetical protein H310_05430 [Aphanomyces invadans]